METKLKISTVGDNQDDIPLAKEYLQNSNRAKFQIQTAGSLTEAVERTRNNTFDCILLDLGLSETPVAVLSNNVDEEIGTQAVRLGAEDSLVKRNLSKEDLFSTVLHFIERFRLRKTIDKKNAEHSKLILDNTISMLSSINKKGNIFFVNPAAEKLFGLSEYEKKEEFIEFYGIPELGFQGTNIKQFLNGSVKSVNPIAVNIAAPDWVKQLTNPMSKCLVVKYE
jgi:CheY-like chemotaxis protein